MSAAAGGGEIVVKLRPESLRLDEGQRTVLERMIVLLRSEALDPGRVEVVVTDRFEQVADQLARTSAVHAALTPSTETYTAVQADGSLAVAMTIGLPDEWVAVIVPTGLLSEDEAIVRRVP